MSARNEAGIELLGVSIDVECVRHLLSGEPVAYQAEGTLDTVDGTTYRSGEHRAPTAEAARIAAKAALMLMAGHEVDGKTERDVEMERLTAQVARLSEENRVLGNANSNLSVTLHRVEAALATGRTRRALVENITEALKGWTA